MAYSKRTFLNNQVSPNNGWVHCYQGDSNWAEGVETRVTIGDCHQVVHLHMTKLDNQQDFLNKVLLLIEELKEFAEYLEHPNDYGLD